MSQVSYAVKYMYRQNPSLCVVGIQKGALRCFLVRVINLYIPSSIAIHGTRAFAVFGSLATTYHSPPVVSGGSFFRDRIFAVAAPIWLLQTLQLFLDESTRVEWAGLAGAWPRPRPERADPWEPRPIRADSDVSFDQGPAPTEGGL